MVEGVGEFYFEGLQVVHSILYIIYSHIIARSSPNAPSCPTTHCPVSESAPTTRPPCHSVPSPESRCSGRTRSPSRCRWSSASGRSAAPSPCTGSRRSIGPAVSGVPADSTPDSIWSESQYVPRRRSHWYGHRAPPGRGSRGSPRRSPWGRSW